MAATIFLFAVFSLRLGSRSEEASAMAWIVSHVRVVCLSLLCSLLMAAGASAQSCTTSADCRGAGICEQALGSRQCVHFACSSDRECSTIPGLPFCVSGQCQSRPGPGGSSSGNGGGIPPSGVGGICGRVTLGGGVVKSIPCRHGLQCHSGRCERLPQ